MEAQTSNSQSSILFLVGKDSELLKISHINAGLKIQVTTLRWWDFSSIVLLVLASVFSWATTLTSHDCFQDCTQSGLQMRDSLQVQIHDDINIEIQSKYLETLTGI